MVSFTNRPEHHLSVQEAEVHAQFLACIHSSVQIIQGWYSNTANIVPRQRSSSSVSRGQHWHTKSMLGTTESILGQSNNEHLSCSHTVVLRGPCTLGFAYSTKSSINTGHAPEIIQAEMLVKITCNIRTKSYFISVTGSTKEVMLFRTAEIGEKRSK